MKLPTEITINFTSDDDGWIWEQIADYMCEKISTETGIDHLGFRLSVTLTASQIMWDTDED